MRELKIKDCYLYLKMEDGESEEKALERLTDTLDHVGIEYQYESEDIEVQDI